MKENQSQSQKTVAAPIIKTNFSSFEVFQELVKEFRKGMLDRKKAALEKKLLAHYKDKNITPKEEELLASILRQKRAAAFMVKEGRTKGVFDIKDDFILSEIESRQADGSCIVKTDYVPNIHALPKGTVCKYIWDAENEKYKVFKPVVIPPEWQATKQQSRKIITGDYDVKDLAPEKVETKLIILNAKEFEAWFEVEEDVEAIDSTPKKQVEEVFTF